MKVDFYDLINTTGDKPKRWDIGDGCETDNLVTKGKAIAKRLLMICNLKRIHWNVGEHLHFQAVSLIKRIECGADVIDIAWLYNPDDPAFRKTGITPDNYQYHLSKLLPLAYVNPYFGSFTLTDSLDTLKLESYEHIFPSLDVVLKKTKIWKMPIIEDFYKSNGFIPHLSCREGLLLWARSFFELRGIVYPVVIHLRKSFSGKRNSSFDTWMKFFRFCRTKKSWKGQPLRAVTFIVIGTRQEIYPPLREIGNVVFSKDYNTNIEQDCALIQSSLMFMGGPSGPNIMAIYGSIPYLIFNFQMAYEYAEGRVFQYPWQTSLQKLIWARETVNSLIEEFTQFMGKIDLAEWKKSHAEPSLPKLKRVGRVRPEDW